MKILAIDSSGLTASAAIVTEGAVLAEYNTNFKKTHSQTLLPMISELMKMLDMEADELDAVAISKGPGSFTGLRIGSATAKGICFAIDRPIIEISSLEAMAYQLSGTPGLICPVMDARRNQVYGGIYKFEGEKLVCIAKDEAMAIEDFIAAVNKLGESCVFLGDGVPVNENTIKEQLKVPFTFARPFQNRQRAAAMGILALEYAKEGKFTPASEHTPVYLRVSQAERERADRLAKGE